MFILNKRGYTFLLGLNTWGVSLFVQDAASFALEAEAGNDGTGVIGAPEFLGREGRILRRTRIFAQTVERRAVGAHEPEAIAEFKRLRAQPPGTGRISHLPLEQAIRLESRNSRIGEQAILASLGSLDIRHRLIDSQRIMHGHHATQLRRR